MALQKYCHYLSTVKLRNSLHATWHVKRAYLLCKTDASVSLLGPREKDRRFDTRLHQTKRWYLLFPIVNTINPKRPKTFFFSRNQEIIWKSWWWNKSFEKYFGARFFIIKSFEKYFYCKIFHHNSVFTSRIILRTWMSWISSITEGDWKGR